MNRTQVIRVIKHQGKLLLRQHCPLDFCAAAFWGKDLLCSPSGCASHPHETVNTAEAIKLPRENSSLLNTNLTRKGCSAGEVIDCMILFLCFDAAQMGVGEGKSIGQWYGPNTVAQVLK